MVLAKKNQHLRNVFWSLQNVSRDLQKIPSEGQRACPEGERGGVSRYDKVFPVK